MEFFLWNLKFDAQAIFHLLEDDVVLTLIESREEEHFSEMDEFLQHKALAGLEIDKQGLAFTSDYFQVLGAVQVGRQQLKHETILKRQETGRPLRVQRQRRGFFGE